MNNKREKILNVIKILYISSMILVLVGVPLSLLFKPLLYISIGLVGVVIALYIIIHILRSSIYEYTCPACNNKFSITFSQDVKSYNSGVNTKVLVCPKCGKKEIMKQTLK